MRKALLIACAMAAVAPVPAAAAAPERLAPVNGPEEYRYCLGLTHTDPEAAAEDAASWRARGGGAPAEHCEALALIAQKQYARAAQKLAAMADGTNDTGMRVQLLDQAGNAWILAEQPGLALPLFSAAIELAPNNIDILADRARARAMHADWNGADTDLTAALSHDPTRADLYVLRASARGAEGKIKEAQADIKRALSIVPDYPDALIERGTIKLETGDTAGARADWQQVVHDAPDSTAAESARANLKALESKK